MVSEKSDIGTKIQQLLRLMSFPEKIQLIMRAQPENTKR
jgi:hypothetical protein